MSLPLFAYTIPSASYQRLYYASLGGGIAMANLRATLPGLVRNDHNSNWHDHLTVRTNSSLRKRFAEDMRDLIRAEEDGNLDVEDLLDLLDRAQRNGYIQALEVLRPLADNLDIHLCPCCEDVWVDPEDDDCYRSDTYESHVCESCAENHIFADGGDSLIDPDRHEYYLAYTSAYRGRPSDVDAYTSTDGLYPLADDLCDGAHYATEDVIDSLRLSDPYGDGWGYYYDEDPDEDDSNGEREDYHSSSMRSPRYFKEPDGSSKKDIPVGMELEIYSEGSPRDALDSLSLNWIIERDGSLDDHYGYEIVSPPLARATWEPLVPELVEALKCEGSSGYNATGGAYGIHLTINRKYLTELQVVRLMWFLRSEMNADFVRAVAQRWEIYNSNHDIGTLAQTNTKVAAVGGLASNKKAYGVGKFAPLNLKSDRYGVDLAEFRIFQSTLEPSRMMKNMEFVWALCAWTRSPSGTSWDHRDFCAWLSSNAEDYPRLVEYLKRETYRVKRSPRAITNSWSHLLLTSKQKKARLAAAA